MQVKTEYVLGLNSVVRYVALRLIPKNSTLCPHKETLCVVRT